MAVTYYVMRKLRLKIFDMFTKENKYRWAFVRGKILHHVFIAS